MSFTADGRGTPTSWGRNSTSVRGSAVLNEVTRTATTDVEVIHSWVLGAGVEELWGFQATVEPPETGRDLEDWIGGEAWETLLDLTIPVEELSGATFALPPVGMVLLAQREPRYTDGNRLAVGEVHRFALYNDGLSWRMWQWFEEVGAEARDVFFGYLVKDAEGSWTLSTAVPATGLLADDGGGSLVIAEVGVAAARILAVGSTSSGFFIDRV